MGTHSSVLTWRIPGTGEPGGLPSTGSHGIRDNWSDIAAAAAATYESHLAIANPSIRRWEYSFAILQSHKISAPHLILEIKVSMELNFFWLKIRQFPEACCAWLLFLDLKFGIIKMLCMMWLWLVMQLLWDVPGSPHWELHSPISRGCFSFTTLCLNSAT